MKRFIFVFCLYLTLTPVFAEQPIKRGLGFGALPAISYDSDLGFQYGALVNFYLYGDGSRFPKYDHSLYLELSTYTKGTSIARLRYDSEFLIPQVRTTVDMSYVTDLMSDFYGFNGYQSVYDPNQVTNSNRLFYKNEKDMFRAKADFQGSFGESKLGWVAGYSFYHFKTDTVNNRQLGITKTGPTLFERYKEWGLISPQEAAGGSINYLKIGLKYDSRDQLACPMKGVFTEAVIQTAPKFLNETFPHSKLAVIHRQYFTLATDLSFAYRLDYQMSIGNAHVPYYAQPLLITSYLIAATNQGLGGKSSIRGILRNRVIGDNVGFGNFEFRYKFLRFGLFKQNFYLGTNVFFDSGIILKPIDINLATVSANDKTTYFNTNPTDRFHSAAGLGLKIGWNENFVISADFGKAVDKQDGNAGFYLGLNYLF
ncbi:MAG: BamA/TamA family outer membrane protein [Bacteroidota bacterium]|nr:BamA/TamA family outer membrane protein [Bacteroidota bacterium]